MGSMSSSSGGRRRRRQAALRGCSLLLDTRDGGLTDQFLVTHKTLRKPCSNNCPSPSVLHHHQQVFLTCDTSWT